MCTVCQGVAAAPAAAAAAGARSSAKPRGGHPEHTLQQQRTSPELNKVCTSPSATPGRQLEALATTAISRSNSRQLLGESPLRQHQFIDGHNSRQGGGTGVVAKTQQRIKFAAPLRGAYDEAPAVAVSTTKEAAKAYRPSSSYSVQHGDVLHQTEVELPHEDGTISSSHRLSISRMPSSPRTFRQDSLPLSAASAADAGAGGGGGEKGSSTGDGGYHRNAGGASPKIGTPKGHSDFAAPPNDGSPKESTVFRSEPYAMTRGARGVGNIAGSGVAGSEEGAFAGRHSRPRSPAAGTFGCDNRTHEIDGSVVSPATASSPFPDGVGSRKRPKKVAAGGDAATADRGGAPSIGRASSPPPPSTATSRQRNHFADENSRSDLVSLPFFFRRLGCCAFVNIIRKC